MNSSRVKKMCSCKYVSGPVVYWMSRDQRVEDNWALIHAQNIAIEKKTELIVVFSMMDNFLEATIRQYEFMISGLVKVEKKLNELNIGFCVKFGNNVVDNIIDFLDENKAGYIVCDFDPLRIKKQWRNEVNERINIPFDMVDAHNVVPVFEASNKLEFGAYTIRKKINKKIPEFLDEFDSIKKQKTLSKKFNNDWASMKKKLKVNFDVKPVDWIVPGYEHGMLMMKKFIDEKIDQYSKHKNDPNYEVESNLSPYLHMGQISAQRVAMEVAKLEIDSKDDFLEQLIVRRELADNYCYYCENYDNVNGAFEWAKKTIDEHREDKREYIYSLAELEEAKTHDRLWNAAQMQMVEAGKMHGYMRMYWAKKILEWTENAEKAIKFAIYLNDKYELDGRDPNGYVGVMWAVCGVHDRAFGERGVFGKIRYMNYNGCKRKFDVEKYINKWLN